MAGFQSLARSNGSRTLQNPPQLQFPPFSKCYGQDCVTLDYRVISSPDNKEVPKWADYVVNYIASKSNLELQKDIVNNGYITSMEELQSYYQEFKDK